MPTYSWQCVGCEQRVVKELTIQEYSDRYFARMLVCPLCGEELTRIIEPAGFQLGGLGWPGKAARRRSEQRKKEGNQ